MKILAVADIHGSQYKLNLILKNIERYSPDLVVVCGDITQYGPGDVAKHLLDQIPIDTLAVMGNIDSTDVEKGIDNSKATKIEMKKVNRKGNFFVGLNAVNPDDIKKIDEKKLIDKDTILVTHVPPYNTQDKVFVGMHGGSKELRELIDKYQPRLVLSGHIHENPGYIKLENTIVVNCSMGKRGSGSLINLGEEIEIKMLE